jgi:hypothetical protein
VFKSYPKEGIITKFGSLQIFSSSKSQKSLMFQILLPPGGLCMMLGKMEGNKDVEIRTML